MKTKIQFLLCVLCVSVVNILGCEHSNTSINGTIDTGGAPFIRIFGTKHPATQPTYVKQSSHDIAYKVSPGASNFYLHDLHVNCGGIVLSNQGAYSIYLENVWNDGRPSGGGVYDVILATKPVESFVWDNTRRRNDPKTANADDVVNGGEASLRIMGRAKTVKIINVNFRNRKHDFFDPTGILEGTPFVRQDWWKQVVQIRDVERCTISNGRVIGLIDVGQQKGTALTPQHVGALVLDHERLTNLPSVTDWKTVDSITFKGCVKIDQKGKVIGKWPDTTWTAKKH